MKTRKHFLTAAILLLWAALTLFAWVKPSAESSDAERRKLAQFPKLSASTLLSGDFMSKFESYSQDQFPLRDSFRTLKSLFHYRALNQLDNNGIYLSHGSAVKLEYPLNEGSLSYASDYFNALYETYLPDAENIYFCIVPDKGYYLAQEEQIPSMDYESLFASIQSAVPWASFIDITDDLTAADYYRTDTHWRQENLLPVAESVTSAMGASLGEFCVAELDIPFYGVYYGQATLPMEPDTLYIMENDVLSQCSVYNHETGKQTPIYDLPKLDGKDPYDVFLSGATPLLTVENPAGDPQRHLIVFRDSFGSSLIPLLLQDYGTVTVIDTRYIASGFLQDYVNFEGADILFLYSTLILNSSNSLK